MKLEDCTTNFHKLSCAIPVWHGSVNAEEMRGLCEQVKQGGGKLLAIWGEDKSPCSGFGRPRESVYLEQALILNNETQSSLFTSQNTSSESPSRNPEAKISQPCLTLHVALVTAPGMLLLSLILDERNPTYPDLSDLFPAANRMQRTQADLLGLHATVAADQRKWLRHAAWPTDTYPLRKSFDIASSFPLKDDDYPFISVTGNGVHEIPVGPVHAGIIEPGHFRFSVVGERVLRLEARLGYNHKGIEKRFEGMTLRHGAKLAGRISGDTTVAYAWAYAQAVECATATTPPLRALWLRGVFLELERIHNHLGDLGYLGNDAALAFGFTQFWILKEDLLRMNAALFSHRYLMDCIVPGGVACDLSNAGLIRIAEMLRHIESNTATLKNIYDEHAGVQDRFLNAGRVTPELAAKLGLTGMAGRASGQAWDTRSQFPCFPYDQLNVQMVTHRNGDVAARVIMRFEEISESIRLIRLMLEQLPIGELLTALAEAEPGALGIGWVEGWRGEVLLALHVGKDQRIQRLHPHDPSWQNWPVLEHAIIDNIVPDFPLINKSFNLSYSGVDL